MSMSGMSELTQDMAFTSVYLPFVKLCLSGRDPPWGRGTAYRREKQPTHRFAMDFLPASLQIRDIIDLMKVVQ